MLKKADRSVIRSFLLTDSHFRPVINFAAVIPISALRCIINIQHWHFEMSYLKPRGAIDRRS